MRRAKSEKEVQVAYICNGKNPKCCGKYGCYYTPTNGVRGACSHTLDPKYAKNKPMDPRKHPDIFDKFSYGDTVRYYEKFVE